MSPGTPIGRKNGVVAAIEPGRVIVEDSKELWPVTPKGWPFVPVRVWIGKEHIVPVIYEETADKFLIHIDTAKKEILAADSLIKVKALWSTGVME